MLGDLNIAEPGAQIGFAGPRVIEQTIRQKLPKVSSAANFCSSMDARCRGSAWRDEGVDCHGARFLLRPAQRAA